MILGVTQGGSLSLTVTIRVGKAESRQKFSLISNNSAASFGQDVRYTSEKSVFCSDILKLHLFLKEKSLKLTLLRTAGSFWIGVMIKALWSDSIDGVKVLTFFMKFGLLVKIRSRCASLRVGGVSKIVRQHFNSISFRFRRLKSPPMKIGEKGWSSLICVAEVLRKLTNRSPLAPGG